MTALLPIAGIGILALLLLSRKSAKAQRAETPAPKAKLPAPATKTPEKAPTVNVPADEEDTSAIRREVQAVKSILPSNIKSVLPGIPDDKWRRYMETQKKGKPSSVTPSFRLGMFLTGATGLKDVGLMTRTFKGTWKGKQVTTGDWAPGMTMDKFLADQVLQYGVFVNLSRLHAAEILTRLKDVLGKPLADGKAKDVQSWEIPNVTLSGLMAVANAAGLGGLQSWAKSHKDRVAHKETSAAFAAANGIF